MFTAISMERCHIFGYGGFFSGGGDMKTFTQLCIGDTASIEKTFSMEDVLAFARISGDANPAHVDPEYAKQSTFGACIVHGFLVGSLFSAILGTKLPGLGTIYTGQTLKFTRPVYIGDTITATITLRDLIIEKQRAIFDCAAINQDGTTVLLGEAVVLPPRE
jgi:acyl dehydratase